MLRSRWISLVCAALIALVMSGTAGNAQKDKSDTPKSLENRIKSQQGELDRIKKKINEHRTQSKKLKKQETQVLSKLSNLEKEINLSQAFLKNLAQHEALMTERIDSLVSAALEAGALGCKINGSGGGGCMFAYGEGGHGAVAEAVERAGGTAMRVRIDRGVETA